MTGEKLSNICNKKKMPTFTTSIQYSTGRSRQSSQAIKRNKEHPTWKRTNQIVIVCRGHDIICGEPPKTPPSK
jgi:hypothetical protein